MKDFFVCEYRGKVSAKNKGEIEMYFVNSIRPELSWEHGFIYSMILTLSAALLPLLYIKHKGWLR